MPFTELIRPEEVVLPLDRGLLLVLDLEVLDELEEPLRVLLPLDPLELPEEPFLLVDLFELERLRVDRLLEDRVV